MFQTSDYKLSYMVRLTDKDDASSLCLARYAAWSKI